MNAALVRRLRAVWETRGASGFLRFLGTRLLQHRRDIVFEAETLPDDSTWDASESILIINRENRDRALTAAMAAQLGRGEGAEYLNGLRSSEQLFAVTDHAGHILHHSYVLFETRTKTILGESAHTPLFAHCVTVPEARGQRLYPRTLRYALCVLRRQGHRRAIINCDPRNAASIAGIERAGFTRIRELDTWILGSCLGVQWGRTGDGRPIRRLYVG